jgi:tetratricopeptide (TPR) repeat protein
MAAWADASAKAAKHYRRAGWSASTCLDNLAAALYSGPKPVDEALAQCEELVREYADDRASEANVLLWMGGLEAMRGRFDAGRELVGRARTIFEELGGTVVLGACGAVEGSIELLSGRPDSAEKALRTSCEIYERLREPALLATRAAELADVLYVKGDYDEARNWVQLSQEHATGTDIDAQSSWRTVAAKLSARAGEFGKAKQFAEDALGLAEETDALNHRAKILLDFSEVMALGGRCDESVEMARESLRLYELKGNVVSAGQAQAMLVEAALAE